MRKRLAATVIGLLVLVLAAGCSRSGQDSSEQAGSPERNTAAQDRAASGVGGPSASEADAAMGRDGGSGGKREALAAAAPDEKAVQQPGIPDLPPLPEGGQGTPGRVIKNISLEVRIEEDEFQRLFARAGSLAEQFGGFVTNSQVSETEGRLASGTLTIRVPSNRFEEAVGRLKGLGEVTAEDRSGQDVSKEFVDLEARLNQAKAEEAFYLRLMDRANGISDMIQIQSQLSAVQLRIEEIQGQLNYLRDQTSFSTISVRLYEPGAPEFGPPRGLARAWEGAVAGFQSVIGGLVVAAGWLAPFALIGLVGLFVLRLRNRPKVPATAEAPPAVQS